MAGISFFLFHALFAAVNPCFQTVPGDGVTTILPPSTSTYSDFHIILIYKHVHILVYKHVYIDIYIYKHNHYFM
ncbi:hypothetical protein WR25_21257 [Diploscapter pachys]|uniref:Secreted protein n=1 Tax=Diploscapter pachys TaxID=2018661 RepID=A0A2A2JDH1_9BILA|nr:hypothetical protein WR25_21257 [Diploscapter pachys]